MSGPPRILMCPPDHYGIEYEINPWMNTKVGSDRAASLAQWTALRAALVELGATVEMMEPVRGLPDLVFTANAGLIYEDLFLSSRFRHGVRQGESPYFETWFRDHGYRVESLPAGENFEGAGDALFCGEALFAGYRFRSDARSHQWLGARLGVEVLPLELVDPRYYHLDTCFCPLAPGVAIYYPGGFDEYGRSVLADRISMLIAVEPEEAITFSCNAVVIGRSVIVNDASPRLAETLVGAGYRVFPIRLTEFIKSGGSAKCLTLRLDGEDAATWRGRTAAVASPLP